MLLCNLWLFPFPGLFSSSNPSWDTRSRKNERRSELATRPKIQPGPSPFIRYDSHWRHERRRSINRRRLSSEDRTAHPFTKIRSGRNVAPSGRLSFTTSSVPLLLDWSMADAGPLVPVIHRSRPASHITSDSRLLSGRQRLTSLHYQFRSFVLGRSTFGLVPQPKMLLTQKQVSGWPKTPTRSGPFLLFNSTIRKKVMNFSSDEKASIPSFLNIFSCARKNALYSHPHAWTWIEKNPYLRRDSW